MAGSSVPVVLDQEDAPSAKFKGMTVSKRPVAWSWRDMLDRERSRVNDCTPIVAWEPSEADFDITCRASNFPNEVRAYSEIYVYFVIIYDGRVDEWIGSVPRHPDSGFAVEAVGR